MRVIPMFTVDYFNACLAVVLMISITGCYIQNPEYPSGITTKIWRERNVR